MRAEIPNTLKVMDTRLAACLSALGFPWGVDLTLGVRKGATITQFLFGPASHRFPELALAKLIEEYSTGALQKKEPMHMLCVMMTAQHNYDAILRMHGGISMRLVSTAGGCMTLYRPGQEQTSITQSSAYDLTDDLCLAAAVGGIGLPVIGWDEPVAGRRTYHIARTGHPVLLDTGELHLHDARAMLRRSPVREDPLRLTMELEQPRHPLCISYDALHHRRELKKSLTHVKPLLMIDEGGAHLSEKGGTTRLSVRQALVSVNAAGRVMDLAAKHMKAPPMQW